MSGTTHRFVSWYRRGIAALRTDAAMATDGVTPVVRASFTVDGSTPELTVSMHGPGDVAALTANAIVRRDPVPSSIGVSPNGIPFVELFPPDLPWRFSPRETPGIPTSTLLPWIALVVVPAAAPFGPRSGAPLWSLRTTVGELPDPREAWAWAHVQVEEPEGGLTATQVPAFLRDHPDAAVARLLGPRAMAANTKYRACIVPVFEAGRRTGLGVPVDDAGTGLAWDSSGAPDSAVELPVYDAWVIDTGAVDDFETIAKRLTARDADDLFAPLEVDVRAAAGQVEPLTATTYGVIRPPHGDTSLPEAEAIAARLEPMLTTDDATEPAIGPPLYAAAQTGRRDLNGAEAWQRELNLDPRRRAQAAAGAAIVRADQEQLVADARAMIGQLDRTNALVRGTQLATLIAQRIRERHIASRPPERIVSTLWPVLAGTPTAATAAAPAAGAGSLLSSQVRRLARPAGPLARGRAGGKPWARVGRDLDLMVAARPLIRAATMQAVSAATPTVMIAPALPAARIEEIRTGLAKRAARPVHVINTLPVQPADAAAVAASALAASDAIHIAKSVSMRIEGLAVASTVESLTEVRPSPDLSRPLADRLAELRPEMFVPGLSALPPDSVTAMVVDQAAVRAILAGANDELTRELTWRGLQVDRRTTLLRQLWARATRDPVAHDIAPIDQWDGGLDPEDATDELTVFIVRSELVRRFPTALYTCLRAVPDPQVGRRPDDTTTLPLFPLIRGMCAPDTAYVGFARRLEDLAGVANWTSSGSGDPGWYFAIQERPGHIRFGLDAAKKPSPESWDDLSWGDFEGNYARVSAPLPGFPFTPRWGSTAAATAAIAEKPAIRVAFHVQELLVR